MIPTVLACALVIVALAGCAVASMYLEERDRERRRRPSAGDAERAPAVAPAPIDGDDTVSAAMDIADPVAVDHLAVDPVAADRGDADPGDAPHETTVVIPGRAAADTAVAVLLGAYVAAGGESARRAAAWVTAAAPSSLDGASFVPGTDLRGRTVAVRRLLEHDENGRCWLTLRDGVDIARGVERHPVTCPTLAALVTLWGATRAAVSAVSPDELARVVAAIDGLEPTWSSTTGAAALSDLAEQLRTASVGGGGARIHVRLTPTGDGDAASAATSAPEVHQTV